MPASPYPISGVVYEIDTSTVKASATVIAYNQRTTETVTVTTNSSGEYSLDLANLSSGYNSGDVIFISAYFGNESIDYRTTTSASDTVGGSETKNLYLMFGPSHAYFDTKLLSGIVTNAAAAVGYMKFYDRTNDLEIMDIRVVASSSVPFNFVIPIKVQGLCIVPSANTMRALIQADV
ncbi:MAG: hypothetical protein K0A90_00200 [Methanosarcinaceae archaeon]|nr:hypothetical protein [Methanosarcinaceae archaeon]